MFRREKIKKYILSFLWQFYSTLQYNMQSVFYVKKKSLLCPQLTGLVFPPQARGFNICAKNIINKICAIHLLPITPRMTFATLFFFFWGGGSKG